jgi:hypothetical protein
MVLQNHPTLRHDAVASKISVGGFAHLTFVSRFREEFAPSFVEKPRMLAMSRCRTYYAIIPTTCL